MTGQVDGTYVSPLPDPCSIFGWSHTLTIEGLQNFSLNLQTNPRIIIYNRIKFIFQTSRSTRSTIRPCTCVFYSFKRALLNKLIPKQEINICSVRHSSSCLLFDMETCLVFFSYIKLSLFMPEREKRIELKWSSVSSLSVVIK